MENTTKKVARMLASMLMRHGVSEAVVSPGSRNAPLIVALERCQGIATHVVIDERSAAFIALGMSLASASSPVALVCTSGTAPLNYAPAIAEAYYRNAPLIVVTADRPAEWIDQDDSQTIRQPGIYGNFIKGTFDLPVESDDPDRMWMINRTINDALILATEGLPGPVHINVRLADPLGQTEEIDDIDPWGEGSRKISSVSSLLAPLSEEKVEALGQRLSPSSRVLVLAGFMSPANLDGALRELSRRPNFIVMHEAQSNLHGFGDFISNIDATLTQVPDLGDPMLRPDIVITLGGSLTSRMVKAWLRGLPDIEHWSIGEHDHSVDCFRRLACRIPYNPSVVVPELTRHIPKRNNSESTSFKSAWLSYRDKAREAIEKYSSEIPWSDFKAMSIAIPRIPRGWNLQLSNGTAVRYAQLFDYRTAARIDCNRGVSGIDGCTSTAIGAACMSQNPTLLITGDMSMQYDMGALACNFIPDNFKIIVLNNGGGGIFRYIRSTRGLDELERYFVADVNLPLKKLASAFGFKYLLAENAEQLDQAWKKLVSANSAPTILEIKTDGRLSAEILTSFLERNKKEKQL